MVVERTYNIPLRREFLKAPKYRRAKKAISAVRSFLVKHMKSDDVLLGPKLNMTIWANGIRNPPHHVKVTVIKDDKGAVRAELFGFDFKKKEKQEKEVKKAGLAGKLQEKLDGSSKPKAAEAKRKEKAEKAVEVKSEVKEKVAEVKEVTEKPAEVKGEVKKEEASPDNEPQKPLKSE